MEVLDKGKGLIKNKFATRGDRFDGVFLNNLDALHIITPILYPNRCDNEAYINETIDLTNINKYLDAKNAALDDEFKYTLFHIVVTALMKTITLRPKLNRFIVEGKVYQRKWVTSSFVVKKKFSDNGAEALAVVKGEPDDTIDTIHAKIREQVYSCRSDKADDSSNAMDIINSLPFPVIKAVVHTLMIFDKHGMVPRDMIATDPYYTSVVISNLGSIKLKCGYHHLTNWGTNSLFTIIGEKKIRPFFNEDGTYEMRDSVQLGITLDERLGDGYYYSKSIRLLKKLLENPELLEKGLSEEVEY